MSFFVFGFHDIDDTKLMVAGGKGANLGELSRIEQIHVPDGFCVSTGAFKRVISETPSVSRLLEQLSTLKAEDKHKIVDLGSRIRRVIENTAIPEEIENEISRFLCSLGERNAYAVRSSATAEDLPTASFAGQQDTYLNIAGKDAIMQHISKCWASLFTERAIVYRLQNSFDHRKVSMAVIVQNMVFPQAAGIVFTADPVTANRRVSSIEAGFGLGEAMVAGLVNPDVYKVQDGRVIEKIVSVKKIAIFAREEGGTKIQAIEPERQSTPALTDEQILRLESLGRKIEEHFGRPQDIEWGLVDNIFYILQSRPITTLYPVPEAKDKENHIYISVGHQQMMTDAMKPLGISVFLLTTNAPMVQAGGRLFVDVTRVLASPESRASLLNTMGQHDPLMKDALTTVIERGDFIKSLPGDNVQKPTKVVSSAGFRTQVENDPKIIADLIKDSQTSIEELRQKIKTESGPALFDFILEDIRQLKKSLTNPKSFAAIMAGMDAASWINEKMNDWLGEKNAADVIAQSVTGNITAEMGVALLDVADVIRPHPEIINYLRSVKDDSFLDEMVKFDGGKKARKAILAYLDKFGMRGSGEIDITRPRWSEQPETLVPLILSNIKNFGPGAGEGKLEQGRRESLKKEQALLESLKQLPDGEQKAGETKRMINLVRLFSGYREYPKYAMVNRYFIYKQALLKEAERLLQANVIREKEDVFYLTFEEFRDAAATHKLDYRIISRRKAEYKLFEKLVAPRVLTSDGEVISGRYRREGLPFGAIVGLPVSSGLTEGRARVIVKMEDADLENGDILVTSFTDPSWTPLFVLIKGLVTEVGGLMTHGSVIAREYGLPAVTGVENATKLIKDGQRIRVNGTDGFIEIV